MPPPVVTLVGPVPPWRSGIADQTVRLARAMQRLGVEPVVVTFDRMYPRALFPGGADRSTGGTPDGLDVRALLDGANPLSFRRGASLVASLGASLLVLPWWTAYWAPHDVVLLSALAARSPRTVKLLLCHNLVDHEGGALKRALARAVFRRADRFVVQNRSAKERLERELGPGSEARVTFVPHPSEPRPGSPTREEARQRLGFPLGAPLFLFTGILRPYKGWDLLLAAFPAVRREFPEARLVFAGEAWGEARGLAERIAGGSGITANLRYLPAEERDLWLAASDAVVCPYRHATGSGIAADAIAHGRPVIGTRVDGLLDVLQEGETALLVPPGDAAALSGAMARFLREGLGPRLAANIAARLALFSPDEHARRILRFGGIEV